MPSDDHGLLRRIDAYLDAAPRTGARAEAIGPFTLFLNEGHGWRYYARPTPDATGFTIGAVRAVRERQRFLAQPEAFEWIDELAPDLGQAAMADAMVVVRHPLMVLADEAAAAPIVPAGVEIAIADPGDDLAAISAVAEIGFSAPGTAGGTLGAVEAAAAAKRQNPDTIAFQRGRMIAGLTIAATARVSGSIAAVGWHQPLDGVSEIVGVSTLPAFRRRGLGAAVTASLVADAIERGVDAVFLSADGDDVARVYARVGFDRVGTAGAASKPMA